MRRAVLVLMILFPALIQAQGQDPQPVKNQPAPNSNLQTGDTPAVEADGSPAIAEDNIKPVINWSTNQQTTQRSKPNKPVKDVKMPSIEGSMVGYVDNAIIGSQIRIRFDAAFNDPFPDRAEFFYAKCSCYRQLGAAGPPLSLAADPNAPGPGPGIPTTINYQQFYAQVEYAPISRFSIFTEVPIRWLQPQGFKVTPFTPFGNQSGLSDVEAGFKFAALISSSHYLTFQFRAYAPSGDSSKGLGTNHWSVEPSLLYYQKLSSRWTVEGQLTYWHPIGGSAGVPVTNSEGYAGSIVNYGIGPSYRLINRESFRLSPVVELVGWKVLGGFETAPGPIDNAAAEVSNINIVNVKAGARASFGRHNSIYAGYGRAVTFSDWYRNLFRMEYRYSF
jgi:hypothetical protein